MKRVIRGGAYLLFILWRACALQAGFAQGVIIDTQKGSLATKFADAAQNSCTA